MDFKYRKLYSADEIYRDRGEGRYQGTRLFRKKMFRLTIFDKVQILVTLTESFLKLLISLLLLLLPLLLLLLFFFFLLLLLLLLLFGTNSIKRELRF